MPKRLRLTRRFTVALSNDAHRALFRFAEDVGLSADEALTFLFENFASVTNRETLTHRLNLFRAQLDAQRSGHSEP